MFKRVFELLDDKTEFDMKAEDGDEVKNGQLSWCYQGRYQSSS